MKFFLKSAGKEFEVSKSEYISAEQNAGFHSKFGHDHIATASFGSGNVSGHVEYEEADLSGGTHG